MKEAKIYEFENRVAIIDEELYKIYDVIDFPTEIEAHKFIK